MKKVVFLGAKEIGVKCLEILVQKQESLGYEIVAVGTSPRGRGICELCKEKGLRLIVDLDEILEFSFDLLFSVQYHKILKPCHIACAKEMAFNLHLAPLPEYRGCNVFSFAIMHEDEEFGVSIHKLTSGIDSGDLLFEKRFLIPKNCFVDALVECANVYGVELFRENLSKMINGDYTLIPQNTIESLRKEFHLRNEIENLKCVDFAKVCGGGQN